MNDHNDGLQSKSVNELDIERKLTKEKVLQIETNTQQRLLLQLEANKIIRFPWD